jgi:hypothetical protein
MTEPKLEFLGIDPKLGDAAAGISSTPLFLASSATRAAAPSTKKVGEFAAETGRIDFSRTVRERRNRQIC